MTMSYLLNQPSLENFQGFRCLSKEEAQQQTLKHLREAKEKYAERRKEEDQQKQKQLTQKRAANAARVRRHRYRKTLKAQAIGTSKSKPIVVSESSSESEKEIEEQNMDTGKMVVFNGQNSIANISHIETRQWREKHKTRKNVSIPKITRTNWFHPFLFIHIDEAAHLTNFHTQAMVKTLQGRFPTLYNHLHRGTIQKWISIDERTGKRSWKENIQKNVERRRQLTGTGRAGILSCYPDIIEKAKEEISGLRQNGVPITSGLARSILLALIQIKQPDLLGTRFWCTEKYTRDFLASVLNLSYRKGTRAAAHLPKDWESLCQRAFFRIVKVMQDLCIPPSLVINMDQTGVVYVPGITMTYEKKGAKQVEIRNIDDKRAYTVCVGSTANGDLLPFQLVYGGTTSASLPSKDAYLMDKAEEKGFQFTCAHVKGDKKSSSHYSTLKTMKEYIIQVLLPYVQKIKASNPELPEDQKVLLLLDCYPVHTGKEFRAILKEFPNIILLYVPANCTGVFQPADVGLQRIIKHHIRQCALETMVLTHREQLTNGIPLNGIEYYKSIKHLRNTSIRALVNVHDYLTTPEGRKIVYKAWEKCIVGAYNLSGKCLESPSTRSDLRKFLQQDQIFKKEVENIEQNTVQEGKDRDEEEEEKEKLDDNNEDTAIPLSSIITDCLDLEVSHADSLNSCNFLVSTSQIGQDREIQGDEEDIWAYSKEGEHLEEGGGH